MAVLVAVAGAGLGSAIGIGGSLGWIVGGIVGNLLFPPDPIVTEGPRLGDLTVTSSAYGAPRQIGFGTIRQAGNMIWTAGIREQKNTRKSGGKGMGGPSQESITYTYFATFAIAFGEGPADDVLRIWADGKIIYDKRGTDPDTNKEGLNFRFYPGNETQLPDASIQAVEGEDATPAYRGTCYILFDDLALQDFGNRIPNITAEITYAGTPGRLATKATPLAGGITSYSTNMLAIDWDRQLAYTISGTENYLRRVNLVTMKEDRQVPGGDTFVQGDDTVEWFVTGLYVMSDGALITTPSHSGGSNRSPISRIDPDTLRETHRFGTGDRFLGMSSAGFEISNKYAEISLYSIEGKMSFLLVGSALDGLGLLDYPSLAFKWANDSDFTDGFENIPGSVRSVVSGAVGEGIGTAYVIMGPRLFPSSGILSILKVSVIATVGMLGSVSTGIEVELLDQFTPAELLPGETEMITSGEGLVYDTTDDTIMFFVRGLIDSSMIYIKYDPNTREIVWRTDPLASVIIGGGTHPQSRVEGTTFGSMYGGSKKNGFVLDTRTGEILYDDVAPLYPIEASSPGSGAYDSRTNSYVGLTASVEDSLIGRWYFNRGTGDGELLSTIVQEISGRCDLAPSDLDVTDLASITVPGFIVGRQSTARAAIEPLSQLYFFDGVESDYVLRFTQRGKTSVRTIEQEELAIIDESTGEFLKESRIQEVELPERFSIVYMDSENDYTQNTHSAKRIIEPTPAMFSRNQMGINAAIAITSETAKRQAEKGLFSAWVERSNFELRLDWGHADLDPADVVTFNLDSGTSFRTRLSQMDLGAGLTIDVGAVSEEINQFVSTLVADPGTGVPEQRVRSQVVVKTILLDSPLLRDADETPSRSFSPLYFFMGGYNDISFRRGSLFKSSDNVIYDNVGSTISGMTWGTVLGTVPDPPYDNPFATDTTTSLTVFMNTGADDLESVTTLQMLNGANAAALVRANGEIEVIQFQDVTENADGSFTLTNLLRGRRGTDTMAYNHTPGCIFLLLVPADGDVLPLTLGELDVERYYKGVAPGQLIEEVERITLTSNHRALMPYAPVHVSAVVDGSNIDISWVRRTRIGGSLKDFSDAIPLAEDTESYEIDILDGPGGSIVRTVTGISTEEYTYTSANITTDFGSLPSELTLRVYQISAQVGRGFTKEVTVNVE